MLNNIPNKYKIIAAIVVVVIASLFLIKPATIVGNKTATVKRGSFVMTVEGNGEVQALKYKNITIPNQLNNRRLRIWSLKITELVPEGTKVKKGDFVAKLDPADVEDRLKKCIDKVDEYQLSFDNAVLDSTIALVAFRDEILNAKDNITEKEIKVEQSKFESKAIQRQTEIDLELAELELQRKERNLSREVNKNKVSIKRAERRLNEEKKTQTEYEKLISLLDIKSPSDGMVVYGRSWGGRKIKVNDDVGPWSPTIAIIPDLNSLVSESIIKEIDIAKIKIGQKVIVGIDAFPGTEFKGEVKRIANIGQPLKGTGMNGFKVMIDIDTQGEKVLPSMTTTNKVTIANFKQELILPRESVFGNDTIKYVFKKTSGLPVKTYLQTAGENESHIRVIEGLSEGDEVLLSRPNKFDTSN